MFAHNEVVSGFNDVLRDDISVSEAEGPEMKERSFVRGDGCRRSGADELPAGPTHVPPCAVAEDAQIDVGAEAEPGCGKRHVAGKSDALGTKALEIQNDVARVRNFLLVSVQSANRS